METTQLRSGFTTGTCAAAAAGAACAMLFTGNDIRHWKIMTPKGTEADLPLFHVVLTRKKVECAVKKDAGDDPDVTHQAMIFASVEYVSESEMDQEPAYYRWEEEESNYSAPLFLTAGEGIGRVTRAGLSCPVGKPAINPVPRSMIFKEVDSARRKAGYDGALKICIWVPEGRRLAEKTFNPRLGIEGGLSILGTTGIVKPMSEEALKATIRLELHVKAVAGEKKVILAPGNYGEAFLKDNYGISMEDGVLCSNFLGESMKMAGKEGFEQILLVGHAGKLIKAAGGVYNTHSKYGDRRMEILWECIESVGEEEKDLKELMRNANTMEEAAGVLKERKILKPVMEEAVRRIQEYTVLWSGGKQVEVVTFSSFHGILGMTPGAGRLLESFARNRESL